MKEVIHTGEPSKSKKRCINPTQKMDYRMSGNKSQHPAKHIYQKTVCRMSSNKSQHLVKHVYQKMDCRISGNISQHIVKHHYQCINLFYSISLYYCKLYGSQPHRQHMYSQWNEKSKRHHQQVWHGKPNILVHIACSSHKLFSYEDCDSSCNRHLIGERKYVTSCDSHKRKKIVKTRWLLPL